MDNQQATPLELSYLACAFDSEGTFTISSNGTNNGQRKHHYSPRSIIGNTSTDYIWHLIKIFDKLDISPYIQFKEGKDNRKDAFILIVKNFNYNKRLIELLLPYLTAKKSQAQIVLRFINRRMDIRDNRGYNIPYDNDDFSLIEDLSKLNKRGESSQTGSNPTESCLNIILRIMKNNNIPVDGTVGSLMKVNEETAS